MPPTQPLTHFVYFDDLYDILGRRLTRRHVAHLVRFAGFPPPRQLGQRRIAWRREEVIAWVASRPAAAA